MNALRPASVRAAFAQAGLVPVDARALMCHVLGVDRAWLAAHDRDPLPAGPADAFFALAKRRRDGEPIAYLVGRREFWGLELDVNPSVLIPRPETETVVEVALSRIEQGAPLHVLDLGTGSGAIALAIAHARPNARMLATDQSEAALEVARSNASRLKLHNVAFIRSDWYAGLPEQRFHVIASNPPYVAAGDPHLRDGDLRFEPPSALTPGPDGLRALKAIVLGAPQRMEPGGSLIVEHGHDQSAAVLGLFASAGLEAIVAVRDLAGMARVAAGRKPRA